MERLLNYAPVVLCDQDGAAALAADVDGLVLFRHLVQQSVEQSPGLGGRNDGHVASLVRTTKRTLQ